MATSTRFFRGSLLHPPFVAIAAAILIAVFFTDLMYTQTGLMQWANFSAWLLVGGLVVALIAAILLLVDYLQGHTGPINWIEFVVLALVAVLSIFNALVHSRDAWTSVVPEGMILSAVSALLLIILSVRGYRVTAPRVREGEVRP